MGVLLAPMSRRRPMLPTLLGFERFVTLLIRSFFLGPRAKMIKGLVGDWRPVASLAVLEDDRELEELRLRFRSITGCDSMIRWAKKEEGK